MSTLIERYLALKSGYRNYDTRHALKRMQAFRRSVQEVSEKGYPTGIELLGSISFGIVEPYSDADCVLLHYCDLHKHEDCPDDCANRQFETSEITRALKRRLKSEMFNIDFLDCINLRSVEQAINEGRAAAEPQALRMLYYRTIGRPVNRPLFIRYCRKLEEDEAFMGEFTKWSSEMLAAYLKTSQHRLSFNKYNERILSKGLALPEEIQNELRIYLDERGG